MGGIASCPAYLAVQVQVKGHQSHQSQRIQKIVTSTYAKFFESFVFDRKPMAIPSRDIANGDRPKLGAIATRRRRNDALYPLSLKKLVPVDNVLENLVQCMAWSAPTAARYPCFSSVRLVSVEHLQVAHPCASARWHMVGHHVRQRAAGPFVWPVGHGRGIHINPVLRGKTPFPLIPATCTTRMLSFL